MTEVFICDAVRTPFGRYGGALASIRTDDLATLPIKALMERNPSVDWAALDDVIYGCVNQAGEDNRNVARMALLLAGLPHTVPGATVNRLCGSSLDAAGTAARAMRCGAGQGILSERDRSSLRRWKKGRGDARGSRRTSAPGGDPRGARQAQRRSEARGHGHRGQRLGRERRRLRDDSRFRRRGEEA